MANEGKIKPGVIIMAIAIDYGRLQRLLETSGFTRGKYTLTLGKDFCDLSLLPGALVAQGSLRSRESRGPTLSCYCLDQAPEIRGTSPHPGCSCWDPCKDRSRLDLGPGRFPELLDLRRYRS